MNYQVYSTTHYLGASRAPVAVLDDKAEANKLADHYSTCSFCGGHSLGNYQTGYCYRVRATNLPVTDASAEAAILRIDDEEMAMD